MSGQGWGSSGPQGPPPGPYGPPPGAPPGGGYQQGRHGQGWPPQGGYGPPQKKEPSYLGWISLALGIASWVFGTSLMTAIPGAILARMELKNIREGKSPPDARTLALAGFWLSMSHIIVAALFIVFFGCIFGASFLIPLISRASH